MRIQHNIMSMNAYRNYNNNTSALSKNLEKLSSGYKINRAGDDAAGLAISEKMRAQITGLEAAQKNVKDGISLINTAEGALQEVQNMLNRMVYLAEESANGTFDDTTDRPALQDELEQLREEINRISQSANFNGITLLDGRWSGTGSSADAEAVTISGMDTVTNTASFTNGVAGTTEPSWTVDFSGISFDKAGDVKVTLGGEEYTIAVTEEMTDAEFAQAVKDEIDGGNGYTDTTGGNYTPTLTGTQLTLQAANQAVETDATLFDDFAVEAADAAEETTGPTVTKTDTAADLAAFGITDISLDDEALELTEETDIKATYDGTAGKLTVTIGSATYEKTFANTGEDAADLATAGTIDLTNADGGKITLTIDSTAANVKIGKDQTTDIAETTIGTATPAEEESSNKGLDLQIGDSSQSYDRLNVVIDKVDCASLKIDAISFLKQDDARKAIDTIKNAINQVSSLRGRLGAYSNRLDHTAQNLSVMRENIQDAESSIRDTDVAEEMMSYTKNNILVQSAQAMLAQANQVPQGVLQLLQ